MELLVVVGKTCGGKTVYAGVYRLFETVGLPLDVILGGLRDNNAIPCWVSFHREARAAGMKHERILSKLDEAISDALGAGFRDHVIQTLQALHSKGLL